MHGPVAAQSRSKVETPDWDSLTARAENMIDLAHAVSMMVAVTAADFVLMVLAYSMATGGM